MQSRRLHRLSRFRRNKRRLRDRLRQRIFFREDRMKPEAMAKPRVVVLTGAGISAESGIKTFRVATQLGDLTRAEATVASVNGEIRASVTRKGKNLTITATVPEGTTAEAVFPSGKTIPLAAGTHTVKGK